MITKFKSDIELSAFSMTDQLKLLDPITDLEADDCIESIRFFEKTSFLDNSCLQSKSETDLDQKYSRELITGKYMEASKNPS